uniref:SRF-dependent transcription regulation-associated protein n=1 Tax=Electrophorus electricus TaxID=8005 RepID=A0AAY5EGD3_ELEEL
MPAALNLSNEVVKMRAEVKRVKVLVRRKLTRQIAALKRKKGTQADLERYQRRAARLLEEMHELKALAPDNITKTALQQDISFQKVCQNKAASLSERATARVATHPDFSRRIQSLKDAVKAFSAERLNAVEAQTTAELESGGSVLQLNDSELESDGDEGLKEELIKGKNKEHEGDDVQGFNKMINQDQCVSSMHCQETPVMSAPPPGRNELITETKKPENRGSKEENDSDLSDGEEEREYFDDSTEERFHKQSSQSEESDDDDFFLGKVSKLKKKKSDGAAEKEKKSDPTKVARLQKAKEAGDARQEFKMQSVFCSTLSKSSDKKCSDGNAKPTWFKSQDPRNDRRNPAQGSKGGPGKVNRPQHSQQTLHPSWEASRKRKEQQAQITGFQGKKIKFDDN